MIHGIYENKFHTSQQALVIDIKNIGYHGYLLISLNLDFLNVSLNDDQYLEVYFFEFGDCWWSDGGSYIGWEVGLEMVMMC